MRFLILILLLGITSCSLNKNIITKSESDYTKHLSHSGKFGKCSLCINQLKASQSNDSIETLLAIQVEEKEQLFASSSEQEVFLLKTSKHILDEPIENSISIHKNESKNILNKKINNYNYKKYSNPRSKSSFIKTFIISFVIIAIILTLLGAIDFLSILFWLIVVPFLLVYGLIKLIKRLLKGKQQTPEIEKSKRTKIRIFAILGFILGIMVLLFLIGGGANVIDHW
ncbi:MAG: hypothetical protein K9I48_02910 [Sphingobacteriales bacterium]|jgi:uncharacterized membrane protein|nr:hypothetical protein [Sphingobacteriales bacterium]